MPWERGGRASRRAPACLVDEAALDSTTYYRDQDGDGYGVDGTAVIACVPPAGHAAAGGDCDDANAAVRPMSAESCNLVDDDCNGFVDDCHGIAPINGNSDPFDDHSHGTHVAGTIGAVGNNGIGVVGVNWNVRLLACKMFDAAGWQVHFYPKDDLHALAPQLLSLPNTVVLDHFGGIDADASPADPIPEGAGGSWWPAVKSSSGRRRPGARGRPTPSPSRPAQPARGGACHGKRRAGSSGCDSHGCFTWGGPPRATAPGSYSVPGRGMARRGS